MRKSSNINNVSLLESDIGIINKHADAKDEIGKSIGASAIFVKRIIELQTILEKQKTELIIHKQSLEGEVGTKTRTVYELQNAILRTIAELVESRDKITGGHIERTQHYLKLLIDSLLDNDIYTEQLSSWNIDLYVMSSQLHDVGKISIRDDILMKPGSLTEEEFLEMKNHTIYGMYIIGKIAESTTKSAFLEYAQVLAGSHHEKWDGSGYPLKLKGDEIPLQGRLMAIIDVYDALTNDRPYKKALSHEDAVDIIRNGSGTHFDPLIAETFLKNESAFKRGIDDDTYMSYRRKDKTSQNLAPALKVLTEFIASRRSMDTGYTERMRNSLEGFINAMLGYDKYKEKVSDWNIDLFLLAAQLHDVGNITVADSILNKAGKLTIREFEEVKSHVDFGVKIIRQIRENLEDIDHDDVLGHAEAMVSSHHERWDGTGYPFGLKGEEIPLQGRVMAIVDVYTALTTERPHRERLSHSAAIGIIKNGSGTHFDPDLVDIFLSCHKEPEFR